jgi:hypothetical protein
MKKLPIGRQHFAGIIQEDLLYVDKTRQIYEMLEAGNLYFLSRPRRFGKSLLVSTLKEIFEGNQGLFKNLYIGEKTNYNWKAYPVLTFNFASYGHKVESLAASLKGELQDIATTYQIQLKKTNLSEQVKELIAGIAQQKGPVALLIDEYDKPLVDFFTEPEKSKKNQDVLRDFFSPLKDLDANGFLRFLFITGVSKFSKVSLFSDLNNLTDLTNKKLAVDLMGITQEELLSNFQAYIKHAASVLKISKPELLKGLKLWYNGYSWDGKTFVYNPFSLLSFFLDSSFKNYWFSTGTPTFLVETIRDKGILPDEIEAKEVDDTFFEKFDVEQLDLHGLLFQTGYLTIKKAERFGFQTFYTLGYPNEEVRQAFTKNLLEVFTRKVPSIVNPALIKIYKSLQKGNTADFIDQLNILLAGISYHLHPKVRKEATKKEKAKAFAAWEGYFHTIVYLICTFLDLYVQTEITKHRGRLDLLVETDAFLYLMEFKLDAPAKDAIAQIKARQYLQSYKNSDKRVFLIGVGFSQEEKNVETWEVEEWER